MLKKQKLFNFLKKMDNYEIDKLLKTHPITKNYFEGAYSYDQLPSEIPSKNCFFIVNHDHSKQSGSHWYAIEKNMKAQGLTPNILVNNTEYGIFFDSYGGNIPEHMQNKIKKIIGNNYFHNKKSLQSNITTTCGQWCMAFIHQRCAGVTFQEFLENFSKSTPSMNDVAINRYVEDVFNTDQLVQDTDFIVSQINKQKCRCRCLNEYCLEPCFRENTC